MLERFLLLAGIGQILVAGSSLAIPRLMRWRESLRPLSPLMRRIFWVYAVYIFSINLFFGLVSLMFPRSLADGSPLAAALTTFIAAYWGGRIAIQFFVFPQSDKPRGLIFLVGEIFLVTMFLFLTAVYSYAMVVNLQGAA